MTESQLREGFSRLAEQVVPKPDAYARLMERRGRRRWRRAGAVTGTVAAVLAAVTIPLALQGGASPKPFPERDHISPWVQRYIDRAAQGGLAGSATYVAQLEALLRVTAPSEYPQVKVAYLDDVDTARVTLVIYHDANRAKGRWLYARAGAPPEAMAAAAAQPRGSREIFFDTPLAGLRLEVDAADGLGFVARDAVAVAPPGCTFSVAPLPGQGGGWSATGKGYLTRVYAHAAGLWRVTCDGKVRFEGPSWEAVPGGDEVTDAQLSGARGHPDPAIAKVPLMSFASLIKVFPLETPKLLYGDAQIAVAIAPVAVEFGGTMRQWAICAYYKQDDYTLLWTKISYWDPSDQNHLIIIPLASPATEPGDGRPSPDDVFMIGGATGETLKVVDNNNAVLSTVHVTGGAGRISVPRSEWESTWLILEGNWGEGGDPIIGGRDYTPQLPPAVSHW